MVKSTNQAIVVRINEMRKHENAETLSVTSIDDYTVVLKTDRWNVGDLGVYIPPDNCVDVSMPVFFGVKTKGFGRITAQKIRGIVSYGLLVKPDFEVAEGEDVTEKLGIVHYDPEEMTHEKREKTPKSFTDKAENAPAFSEKYDVDAFKKYGRKLFTPDELVYCSEKIHGENARYTFSSIHEQFFCGSRSMWKREYPKLTVPEEEFKRLFPFGEKTLQTRNKWHVALTEKIKAFLKDFPDFLLFGELYGNNKGMKYGIKGDQQFVAFDIRRKDGTWVDSADFLDMCKSYGIPHVPVLEKAFPFDFEKLTIMAEGNTLLGSDVHIREGIVIRPVKERWDERLGRVILKIHNPEYLLKGK